MDDVVDLSSVKPLAAAARREKGPCNRCRFSSKDGPDLICQHGPPQVTHVPVPVVAQAPPGTIVRPGQQAIQGMAIQTFSSWPVVKPDQGCFAFEMKAGATN